MANEKETPVIGAEVEKQAIKPSYEQLEKQVYTLIEKYNELKENAERQLSQANMFNTFKQLDYCFKVVENSAHFDTKFVEACKNDIMHIMSGTEEAKDTADKE